MQIIILKVSCALAEEQHTVFLLLWTNTGTSTSLTASSMESPSRHMICILGLPVVGPTVVTTVMKTTPRHRWVFTIASARALCALTKPHSQLINSSIGIKGAHVLASGIGAFNGWHFTRDLTPTAEETGNHRFTPRAPLCRG